VFSKSPLIAVLVSLLFSVGNSRPPGEDPVLDSLVSAALANNPDLQATTEKLNSSRSMVSPSGALPDPMAMVALSGPLADSWVGEPMAMPNVAIGLSQKFPFPGKQGAMKSAAESMSSGMEQMLDMTRQNLAAAVRTAYYDLAYWLTARETIENNIRYITELESVVRERYKVGSGLQANVLQAQKTITKFEDQRLMIEQMIATTRARLNQLVGISSTSQVNAALPTLHNLPELDRSELTALIKQQNPQLRKSGFDIEARKAMLSKARLDCLPDITLGATYGIRWENQMFPMFSEDMLTVSAGINIPLWAGWKQKNLVSSARANLRQAEYSKQDMQNKLEFMLDKNLLEYDRSRSRYTLYSESYLPQSRSALESARAAYEVGRLEFMDVIGAQVDLFNAELETQKSLADCLKTLSEIDALTANAVPHDEN